MARPKNLIVENNGSIISVTPKNLKAFLKDPANNYLVGKSLGVISVDVTGLTDSDVGANLLRDLGLDEDPTPTGSEDVVVTAISSETETDSTDSTDSTETV
jgi:hypothetical protein